MELAGKRLSFFVSSLREGGFEKDRDSHFGAIKFSNFVLLQNTKLEHSSEHSSRAHITHIIN